MSQIFLFMTFLCECILAFLLQCCATVEKRDDFLDIIFYNLGNVFFWHPERPGRRFACIFVSWALGMGC